MLGNAAPATMVVWTIVWLCWAIFGLISLVYFLRGMRALVEIPGRLERIERALAGRTSP